jgi:hypothetical protein
VIKVFLTILLGGLALLVGLQRTTTRLLRAVMLVVVATGATFVWMPDQANAVAAAVGIGRGADLMLYLWVVITFAVILLLYLRIIKLERQITALTRALALAHPSDPSENIRS